MKRNLRHKAYEKIKEMIIFVDMKPGQKIVETEIAEKLKIGRTPVREALLMLENERLVNCGEKKGFAVRSLSMGEMKEYFKMRMLMEQFAIPLIIERITPSELKTLEKNLTKAGEAVENDKLRDIIRYETHFHDILYKSTKSDIFIETISYLVDKFQWLRAIGLSAEKGARESFDDHRRIFDAIIKKDEKRLKKLIEEHLRHAEQKVSTVWKLIF